MKNRMKNKFLIFKRKYFFSLFFAGMFFSGFALWPIAHSWNWNAVDVGPSADGRIPVIMQQRLIDMGQWLKTNGEAIYETLSWNVAHQPDIQAFFTTKGKDLYVICTQYPDKPVTIRNVDKKPVSVTLLSSHASVKYSNGSKDVTITPPVLSPNNNPGEYAWVFKLSGCL